MRKVVATFGASLAAVVLAAAPAFADCGVTHTASTETASKESLTASAGQTVALPQAPKQESE